MHGHKVRDWTIPETPRAGGCFGFADHTPASTALADQRLPCSQAG
ncbi:hypothetical protein [Kibdelosporangium philippinense]